jgi:hypothetical protein
MAKNYNLEERLVDSLPNTKAANHLGGQLLR